MKALLFASLLSLSLLMGACKKDEQNVAPNINPETITTITLTLTNTSNTSDVQTATWQELNPSGGTPDTSRAVLSLTAGNTYSCVLREYDKTQNPPTGVEVTDEVRQRSNLHHIFYQPVPCGTAPSATVGIPGISCGQASALQLTLTLTDLDTNTPPLPVGLNSQWVAGAASYGLVRVVQRHQPGVKDGSYAPGETDFDINYRVSIY